MASVDRLGTGTDQEAIDFFEKRRSALETERSSFRTHWQDIAKHIQPRRGRFLIDDINKGGRQDQLIVNNTATRSLRIATSGLLAGTASPTRPWFELETVDKDLMESQAVKLWMYDVTQLIKLIFHRSNFYDQLSQTLSELILFGTASMSHVDDFEDVARFYNHTIGSFCVQMNDRRMVDTFVRHFTLEVEAIVREYGYDNCSSSVKRAYDMGNYTSRYPIVQYVSWNRNQDPEKPWANNMPYQSSHYEPGDNRGKFLRVSGFNEFPVHVPRWGTTDGDTYGTTCPGMVALGDVRSLQIQEKRKQQGVDKLVNPPLHGPAALRGRPVSSLPGGLTTYTANDQHSLKPVYQVQPPVNELGQEIMRTEQRIQETFYVDLFMAISSMEGIQPRNQLDLMYRNQERLLQLGPVLEHIHGELLGPAIDRTFNQAARAGILPDAPPEIEGEEIEISYISNLAMAQRAVATEGIDRLAFFVTTLAQTNPQVIQKFDYDQAVDEYASVIGVTPRLVVPDEVVAQQREQQAQMARMQQTAELAQAGANTAKMAADAKTGDEENLLTDVRDNAQQG